MWLITTDGFISLVQDRHNHNMLQVRARVRADIERHFPSAYIYAVDGADYRYRARISKEKVALVIADKILNELTYDSHFKDVAIAKDRGNAERRSAYYGVWTALAKLQDWAPYASRSRKDQAAWNRANPLPKTAPYTTGRYYPGMAPLPTFEEARSIPGSPWRDTTAPASRVERDEAARLPEVWEGEDVNDPDLPDDDLFDESAFEGWPAIDEFDPAEDELDAVEEAFGVNSRTLPDDDLQDMLSMLHNMNYMSQRRKKKTKRGQRYVNRARRNR